MNSLPRVHFVFGCVITLYLLLNYLTNKLRNFSEIKGKHCLISSLYNWERLTDSFYVYLTMDALARCPVLSVDLTFTELTLLT